MLLCQLSRRFPKDEYIIKLCMSPMFDYRQHMKLGRHIWLQKCDNTAISHGIILSSVKLIWRFVYRSLCASLSTSLSIAGFRINGMASRQCAVVASAHSRSSRRFASFNNRFTQPWPRRVQSTSEANTCVQLTCLWTSNISSCSHMHPLCDLSSKRTLTNVSRLEYHTPCDMVAL